jgi:hypothetical protein
MRPAAPLHRPRVPLAALLLAALLLTAPLAAGTAFAADADQPEDITGRVVAGLDKVFIKDAAGYCLVEGLDLSPYAGRSIVAKALVIRADQEYRTVRLLHYRIVSPDDDSPGAEADAPQPRVSGKKRR